MDILSFGLERTKGVVTQKREEIVPTERNQFNVDKKERIKFLEQGGGGDPFVIKLFVHLATIMKCLLCFSHW